MRVVWYKDPARQEMHVFPSNPPIVSNGKRLFKDDPRYARLAAVLQWMDPDLKTHYGPYPNDVASWYHLADDEYDAVTTCDSKEQS